VSAPEKLYWAAFCMAVTAALLFIIIRLWIRHSPPPDETDYSDGL
jgi:hypothetical protein